MPLEEAKSIKRKIKPLKDIRYANCGYMSGVIGSYRKGICRMVIRGQECTCKYEVIFCHKLKRDIMLMHTPDDRVLQVSPFRDRVYVMSRPNNYILRMKMNGKNNIIMHADDGRSMKFVENGDEFIKNIADAEHLRILPIKDAFIDVTFVVISE